MISGTVEKYAADQELLNRSEKFFERAEQIGKSAREAFRELRRSSTAVRNQVLQYAAEDLIHPDNVQKIVSANVKDLEAAKAADMNPALQDRLRLDEKRIHAIAAAVLEIAAFPDPVGEIISGGILVNGIELKKKRVPLGVVFTIFESRPNVTVDIGALSIKSGNAAVLRGGKEALHSNKALYEVLRQAVVKAGMPASSLQLVDDTDRAFMLALLKRDDLIDIVVPRGGETLIKFVASNSRIPVVKHDKGVCNLFIDESAEKEEALQIAVNAKLQRPSVCNAIENLILHEKFPHAEYLLKGLAEAGAILSGCEKTKKIFSGVKLIEDPEAEYDTEFLDNRLSVKVVKNVDEAVSFIYAYGSGHSEAIVSKDAPSIERFSSSVDSSAVFINCSTRFNDGGMMGMGAEVGISTGRLHVRGPMGVRDLTTTTYIMTGNGQIRN